MLTHVVTNNTSYLRSSRLKLRFGENKNSLRKERDVESSRGNYSLIFRRQSKANDNIIATLSTSSASNASLSPVNGVKNFAAQTSDDATDNSLNSNEEVLAFHVSRAIAVTDAGIFRDDVSKNALLSSSYSLATGDVNVSKVYINRTTSQFSDNKAASILDTNKVFTGQNFSLLAKDALLISNESENLIYQNNSQLFEQNILSVKNVSEDFMDQNISYSSVYKLSTNTIKSGYNTSKYNSIESAYNISKYNLIEPDHNISTYNSIESNYNISKYNSIESGYNISTYNSIESNYNISTYNSIESDYNISIYNSIEPDHNISTYNSIESDYNTSFYNSIEPDHNISTYNSIESDYNTSTNNSIEPGHNISTYNSIESDYNTSFYNSIEPDHNISTYNSIESDYNTSFYNSIEPDHNISTYNSIESDYNTSFYNSIESDYNTSTNNSIEPDHNISTYNLIESEYNIGTNNSIESDYNISTYNSIESDYNINKYKSIESVNSNSKYVTSRKNDFQPFKRITEPKLSESKNFIISKVSEDIVTTLFNDSDQFIAAKNSHFPNDMTTTRAGNVSTGYSGKNLSLVLKSVYAVSSLTTDVVNNSRNVASNESSAEINSVQLHFTTSRKNHVMSGIHKKLGDLNKTIGTEIVETSKDNSWQTTAINNLLIANYNQSTTKNNLPLITIAASEKSRKVRTTTYSKITIFDLVSKTRGEATIASSAAGSVATNYNAVVTAISDNKRDITGVRKSGPNSARDATEMRNGKLSSPVMNQHYLVNGATTETNHFIGILNVSEHASYLDANGSRAKIYFSSEGTYSSTERVETLKEITTIRHQLHRNTNRRRNKISKGSSRGGCDKQKFKVKYNSKFKNDSFAFDNKTIQVKRNCFDEAFDDFALWRCCATHDCKRTTCTHVCDIIFDVKSFEDEDYSRIFANLHHC